MPRPMTQGAPFHGTERFSIIRPIGSGGMGVVYEAFDRERNERVALKTLADFDALALYRFKQEFRSLSEILHPHLIPLYELVGTGDRWFFTMELVENATDLLTFLRGTIAGTPDNSSDAPTIAHDATGAPGPEARNEASASMPAGAAMAAPLPTTTANVDRVREVFRQLAVGVTALHAADKLHRDLKPSNVLVTDAGRVVILDFGLVANLADAPSEIDSPEWQSPGQRQVFLSTDDSLAGTFAFMSPEQAARAALTPASDWYTVGVMLFQALTGRLPFEGPPRDVLAQKLEVDAPIPSQLVSGIPDDLERLIVALLRRDAAERPSAGEILSVLGTATHDAPSATAVMPDIFVGRGAHLRALEQAFRAMRSGRVVVCHVSGGSGAGKSTLLSKFLDGLVVTDDAVVLRGRCYEQESVPYKALDSLVDSLARYLLTLDHDDVGRMAPPHVGELARVFPVLARVPAFAASTAAVAAGDPRTVRRHATEALRSLLVALGRTAPLVLCIDDLHWGDLDSASVISELVSAPGAPQLLLILSYRSEYLETSACLKALRSRGEDSASGLQVRIDVDALTPDDTRVLTEALLGGSCGGSDSRDAIDWVVRESGGRPLFVYELVAHLKSGAALETRPDLDTVLWERVVRLPEVSRRLLEVIAVAGRPVQLRDAQTAALLPMLPTDVVANLRAARLVRTSGRTLHDEIETFHDRIRESITARLSLSDRRHYHASLAATLEHAGRADAETLAAHFEGADDRERASGGYEQAALEAVHVVAFERAEALFRRAAALTTDKQVRARIHERMIHFYTDMARFADAYETGRSAVEPFGVRLPAKFIPPLFIADFAAARLRLRGKNTADLLSLPTATDERLASAIRLMNAVAKAAYQIRPELCVAVATKIVNLCLRHGNTRDCAIGYMVFGSIFHGGVLGNHRFGYEFGRLALSLVERYGNDQQRAEVNFVVGYFGTSWLRPATEAETLWKVAYDAGLHTGDLFHTGCACAGTTMSRFMRGVPLQQIWETSEGMLEVLRRNRLKEPIGVITAVRQSIRNLRGETVNGSSLDDDAFDEGVFVRELASYGSRHFAHMYFIVKMQVLYLRGEYDAAIEMASRSATFLKDSPGMLHVADHYFYQALAHAAAGQSPRLVERTAGRFRKWAAGCPDNFLHKLKVIEGERSRVSGRLGEAADAFASAAEAARQYGYLHVEALAADLESRALEAAGRTIESEHARARSTEAYRRWGATSLCRTATSPSPPASAVR
jgi:serine/threonine protein kinase/predicted ATPase